MTTGQTEGGLTRHRGYQRCSRVDYSDGANVFAVTFCVSPRRPFFTGVQRCGVAAAEIRDAHEQGVLSIYAYCIMPDHVHLITGVGADGLPAGIGRLKLAIGRRLRALGALARGEALWQKSYFDHRIRREESFAEKCAYVFENPRRAGLVQDADAYPWQGVLTQWKGWPR